jgi:4,5-dihydroxyphthalate decarboxylase
LLGPDPWEFGLTPANRKNLETLIGYSKAGGLISKLETVDDFYLDVMLQSRGRGESARD